MRDDYGSDDERSRATDFYQKMPVEARYRGRGSWYKAHVIKIHARENVLDVVYEDGEIAMAIKPSAVRKRKDG